MLGELGLKQEALGQASSSGDSNSDPAKDQTSPKVRDAAYTMGFIGIPLIWALSGEPINSIKYSSN